MKQKSPETIIKEYCNDVMKVFMNHIKRNTMVPPLVFTYHLSMFAAQITKAHENNQCGHCGDKWSSFEDDMVQLLKKHGDEVAALCDKHKKYEDAANNLMKK